MQTFERKGTPDQIDQSLRTYADFVTKQYELAAKHAQRKLASYQPTGFPASCWSSHVESGAK